MSEVKSGNDWESTLEINRMSRRSLLAGASLVLGASVGGCAAMTVADRRYAFNSKGGIPLGIQLYTLGSEATRDVPHTFAQLAQMGYRQVELPQVSTNTAAATAAAAANASLEITSVHLSSGKLASSAALTLDDDSSEIIDTMGILGAKFAVLPLMPLPGSAKLGGGRTFPAALSEAIASEGRDYWVRLAELLNIRAAALVGAGIGLGYHNHNLEFAPLDGTTGWSILVERTDPRLVHFEMDIGWVKTAGLDPAAMLRSLGPRVRQLHLKDVAAGASTNFALETKPAIAGTGVVDWTDVMRAAQEFGVKHAYVEQEPPFEMPRMEAVRQNAAFFSALQT